MRFSSLKLEAVPFSLAVNTYPTTFAFDTAGMVATPCLITLSVGRFLLITWFLERFLLRYIYREFNYHVICEAIYSVKHVRA